MTQTIERTKVQERVRAAARPRRRERRKPSCQTCFFGNRGLCALDLDEPCSTYRLDDADGLRPPTQPALLARESELAA